MRVRGGSTDSTYFTDVALARILTLALTLPSATVLTSERSAYTYSTGLALTLILTLALSPTVLTSERSCASSTITCETFAISPPPSCSEMVS